MSEMLTPQQKLAVENRGGKLLVSAAAGSGKTKVLVDRLMSYLTDPSDPANMDDFLIITYTKAAAAELRAKISDKLTAYITDHPELNKQYVSYPGETYDPLTLVGENSDDYPLAAFSATVDSDTPAGRYSVEFMSGEYGAQCEILYKYGRLDTSFKEFFPAGEYAKPINISVSDRMLGDIDNDGKITGSDATMILSAYTNISSSGESKLTKEQEIAADIDADGIITGSDATLLLRYYTALSSGEERSVYDYFLE